jgi:hypothetical protein
MQTVTIEISDNQPNLTNGTVLGDLVTGKYTVADLAGCLPSSAMVTITVSDNEGGFPVSQSVTLEQFAKILS